MPVFRCDYNVKGDIVLPKDAGDLVLNHTADFSVTLRNGPVDENEHIATLIAIVIGSATSADEAETELRNILASHLDLLSFSTHSRFEITGARRQIDWEPNQKERAARIFAQQDAQYPPEHRWMLHLPAQFRRFSPRSPHSHVLR